MDKNRHVAIWLRMLARKEVRLARDAKRFLKSLANKMSDAYKIEGHAGAETIINQNADNWVKILIANYAVTIRDFANYIADVLPGGSKANFQDLVQGFISRQAINKARMLSETTKQDLTRIIINGQQDGLGSEAIANNIRKQMGGVIADNRARMIARTETHMAAGFASQAQAADMPLTLRKTWVAVEDERTRPTHSQADGQTVSMDEYFDVGDDQLLFPGDPNGSAEEVINCRCTVIYTPESGNIF
jgi:SPP1 gp7 family putative phage head morphogenesis protein